MEFRCMCEGLTWLPPMCSWGQRLRSSGWRPPDSSHPPPRSGHSPWSWRTKVKASSHTIFTVFETFSSHVDLCSKTTTRRHEWLTRRLIVHSTLFPELQQCQTLLGSQISTAITPDYCLTKRQRRRGTKQSRRVNEDMEAGESFPEPQQQLESALLRAGWRVS